MAGYSNEYYQNKADQKNKQLISKKLLSLQKILQDSMTKLNDLNKKKDQQTAKSNAKTKQISENSNQAISENDTKGSFSSKESENLSILKGLGGSGNAKRNVDIIKSKADVLSAKQRSKAHNDIISENSDLINRLSNIDESIKAVNKNTDNLKGNAENQYQNDIQKVIDDIMDEQARYKENIYKSIQSAKLKKKLM